MTASAFAWVLAGVAGTLAVDAARALRWGLAIALGGLFAAGAGAGAALDAGWRVAAYDLGEIATVRLVPAAPPAPAKAKASDRIRTPAEDRP